MSGSSALKHGLVDLAAVMFVIGGVVSFLMSILTIPITNVYPLTVPATFSTTFLVVLAISLIASLGAIHCYSLASRRLLSEAGIRGIIFGSLLLIFSLGFAGSANTSATVGTFGSSTTILTVISSFLILIAGIICFALRHTSVSASQIAREHAIVQPSFEGR